MTRAPPGLQPTTVPSKVLRSGNGTKVGVANLGRHRPPLPPKIPASRRPSPRNRAWLQPNRLRCLHHRRPQRRRTDPQRRRKPRSPSEHLKLTNTCICYAMQHKKDTKHHMAVSGLEDLVGVLEGHAWSCSSGPRHAGARTNADG